MKKNYLILFALVTIFFSKTLKAQVWEWAKSSSTINNTSSAYVNKLCVDDDGNVVVVGYFFGQEHFGNNIQVNQGKSDIYVAKYTPAGDVIWVTQIGGEGYDVGKDVVIDNQNNIYITGYFEKKILIGEDGDFTLNAKEGSRDILLAKISSEGEIVWLKGYGTKYADWGNALDLDNKGNVYLTGCFGPTTATFDSKSVLSQADDANFFLAKAKAETGLAIWVKTALGQGNMFATIGKDLVIDKDKENLYVTGTFAGTTSFDSKNYLMSGPASAEQHDGFLVKYSIAAGDEGTVKWTEHFGQQNNLNHEHDAGEAVGVDQEGNVYVAGRFNGNAVFSNKILQEKAKHAGDDVFLVKYTDNATLLWTKHIKGKSFNNDYTQNQSEIIRDMCVSNKGNVFLVGSTSSPVIDFDDGVTLVKSTTEVENEVFVARVSMQGKSQWAKMAGNHPNDQFGSAIDITSSRVYVAGNYTQKSIFKNKKNQFQVNTNFAKNQMFLAKINTLIQDLDEKYKFPTLTFENDINIYPNPASKYLMINISDTTKKDVTVQIYSNSGEMLLDEYLKVDDKENIKLDISLPIGLYLIKVDNYMQSIMIR